MSNLRSANPNYEKRRCETISAVTETLRKIQHSGNTYNTLAELLKAVSIFSGVSRSTLRPYRNAEAYGLVVKYYGSQAVNPEQIPDEVADEYVLRIKLALLRAENAELLRMLRSREHVMNSSPSIGLDEQNLMDHYHALTQILLRSHGSFRVNEERSRIEDIYPERGLDPVIVSGAAIRQFASWLRSHPTWGARRELFINH